MLKSPVDLFKMKKKALYKASISDPVSLIVQEGSEAGLQFTEPGSGGAYEEITWYKGLTGSSSYRIVYVRPSVNEGQPLYYNGYCSGSSPCETSEKGQLNMTTGEFTIHSVELTDDDYYYYNFYIGGGSPDTGHKYEINLTVFGERHYFDSHKNQY